MERTYNVSEAADEYGNGCKHGLLFPVLLVIANKRECPNYRFQKKGIGWVIKTE